MAKISSYGNIIAPVLTDQLIGTDVGGTPADTTKNFLLSDIQTLFKAGIALSDVLAAGNTATANIVITGDITASGTITGGGISTSGTVTATGTVSGGDLNSSDSVKAARIIPFLVGQFKITTIPAYDNIAAANAALTADSIYKTSGLGGTAPFDVVGVLMIRV
jgi:hypothetical protein